ncbi:MAG: prolyl oligopeptidase family serine peptidase [Spirochaetales bacterium]|nr:prolyl oligopeptidase family serine peptidase [Spirochaetales bacterium]
MKQIFLPTALVVAFVFSSCASNSVSTASLPVVVTPGEHVDVFIPSGESYAVGTMAYPEELAEPVPAVLLLPGFMGERDELPVTGTYSPQEGGRPLGMWELTSHALADEGMASLRIDYRNSGRAPGKWEDATVTRELEDVYAALAWLQANPAVDASRIAICGLSQGGALAALASGDDAVSAVVLWSAAADLSEIEGFVPQEQRPELHEKGIVTFQVPWGEEVTMKKAYFDSVEGLDPLAGIAAFDGPLLSLGGTQDQLISPQPDVAQSFLDVHDGPEDLGVIEADHTFNNFMGPDVMIEVATATAQWLKANL